MDKSVHVLGLGNLGKYVAYALMRGAATSTGSPPVDVFRGISGFPPVTLMFHRPSLLDEWTKVGRSIRKVAKTGRKITQESRAEGFGLSFTDERSLPPDVDAASIQTPIKYLVVATKAHATADALAPLKDRLNKDSHVLFLQNGMGVIDEVSDKVFCDPTTRPTYWAGICSAGVYRESTFSFVHAGRGPLTLGTVGSGSATNTAPPADENDLVAQLLKAEMLETHLMSPEQIIHAQLKKLVVNSVINPVTALCNIKNGRVFVRGTNPWYPLALDLLKETGPIVRALLPPQSDESVREAFSDKALTSLVKQVAEATAENTSSMLQDVQADRKTEIDYINGYIIAQGKRLGLRCKEHETVVEVIQKVEEGGIRKPNEWDERDEPQEPYERYKLSKKAQRFIPRKVASATTRWGSSR